MGQIILIEGTDCSGKETQTNMLIQELTNKGYKVEKMSFPEYSTPTGKIVGGPYLGKGEICSSWFSEGAVNLDAKVASLYFAADRRYSLPKIKELLSKCDYLILDRYVFSNMAHQGGKINEANERLKMYKFIETLEFELLELPRPDKVIFLYMPYKQACILKKNRTNLDEHEKSMEHLLKAEKTYLELVKLYNFIQIDCTENDNILSREEINSKILSKVLK